MGELMMLFANWKKPLKLTTAAVLLFSLCVPRLASSEDIVTLGAAVWHCVYLTS